ncbi:class I SAM-dependent DNA methyltransferase [Raineyella sp. LH-20]|uniref:HsdM family class I SAM-dependent methyltransferase n=1 Tax=Raineyella sp. LH-20 TaxID=3081204 RepID=UPI00295498FF|nr:N-6 DNA methylase [Raineyella sp. LH-20]WOP17396.1 N-6 DNA methylase [Raineyella sp. LH-20]
MGADTPALRKARGAFFTPEPIAEYVVKWAVRSSDDVILEPSCGEAAFLLAAGNRLDDLGLGSGELHGAELHEQSAETARDRLAARGHQADIRTGDFFAMTPTPRFDVVVGNPPYVRYQDFSGVSRVRSRQAALRAGVALTQLASSWAAFVVHSALFLRQGGRIGLVVPAELLSVNYAAPVRQFLMGRFASVRLVHFLERVFGSDVQEEVVLLLADGYDPDGPGTDHCELYEAQNAAALSGQLAARKWAPETPASKWTDSLVGSTGLTAYQDVLGSPAFTTLEQWGDTSLGIVTGNNKFFALSPARVAELGIPRRDLMRLSPPGSSHLRGMTISTSALTELGNRGSSVWLFRPNGAPSEASAAYIAAGEMAGVDRAYKCRVRSPWWRVPLPAQKRPADLFLTYMNADTVRLCANTAKAWGLNSIHGVYLRSEYRGLADLLAVASLNSVTMLGAEIVGRAYGGGVLKMEPREADAWPMPAPELVLEHADALTVVRSQLGRVLRSGQIGEAAKLVDDAFLVRSVGLSRSTVAEVREARQSLSDRRKARGRA